MASHSSSATSKDRSNWLTTIRFSAAFCVSKNIIEVPLSYHRQWRPYYPTYVLFQHNGTTHFIRLRRYGSRYFFFMASKSLEELTKLTTVSSYGFLVVTKIPPSRWMSLDLSLANVVQGRF
ncbi:hypothetical protein AAZX31_12G150500 [Glycine max]|nr:hypothetical protein JHK87_033984 [Glycine soja]